MSNGSTNHRRKKINTEAARLLRSDHGAITRIARRLGVNPSTVSRVANGRKTSERVRIAISRYLVTRARQLDTAAFLIEHGARR
jgi:transposase-like protein